MDNDQFQKMVLVELKEIKAEQKKTCIELASQKKDLNIHLDSIEKKERSKKEKISYVITGISITITILALFANFN